MTGLANHTLPIRAHSFEQRVLNIVDTRANAVEQRMSEISDKAKSIVDHFESHRFIPVSDRFERMDSKILLDELVSKTDSWAWQHELKTSFLNVFVKHHPEYQPAHCILVSGSSRTALGLLGFHCDLREVIVPDLSWSYEQCFPATCAVPLTPKFEIDVDAMIHAIAK